MIEVFFCSVSDENMIRMAMADLCAERWFSIEEVDLYAINETLLGCSSIGFQRMRRIWADQTATQREYIVADDDVLLPADFDLKACLRIFRSSGFATLSLLPSNCTIQPWVPSDGYIAESTPDAMEHVSAGHVRFCLKGHLHDWPDMVAGYPGYDRIHADAVRAVGGRVGYFRNHRALHLGEGFSSVWTPENLQNV